MIALLPNLKGGMRIMSNNNEDKESILLEYLARIIQERIERLGEESTVLYEDNEQTGKEDE